MFLESAAEFLAKGQPKPPEFWITPYLPARCICLLHGKTSIGKTPLSWRMALSVALGLDFFGFPARAGKVLYCEFDAPREMYQARLYALLSTYPPCANLTFWWADESVNIFSQQTRAQLGEIQAEMRPDLVFVNSLRKTYVGKDIDSSVPSQVYSLYRQCFPQATICFSHHNAKDNPDRVDEQAFAGSQAWANDAQSVFHLKAEGNDDKGLLTIKHTKSGASAKADILRLRLTDGAFLELDTDAAKVASTYAMALGKTTKERREWTCQELGISRITFFRRMKEYRSKKPRK